MLHGMRTLLLFSTVVITLTISTAKGSPAPPAASSAPGACAAGLHFPAVTVTAPVNGAVSVAVADLVPGAKLANCLDAADLAATVTSAHARTGTLVVREADRFQYTGDLPAADARQHVVFTPRRDFTGASEGWRLAIATRDGASLGMVTVTFLVRNTLPVASDDTVTVTPGLTQIDVGAASGLLANDSDANGHRMSVYSDGVTRFPWGTVEIRQDGSFRVMVTHPEAIAGFVEIRYVVWDNQGSPTSTDVATLTIRFAE